MKLVKSKIRNQTSLFKSNKVEGLGRQMAQCVKRWPANVAAPRLISAKGEIYSIANGVPLLTSVHLNLKTPDAIASQRRFVR